MAFLSRLAPGTCTDYTTNVEAVAMLMAEAGINDQELSTVYGLATSRVAKAFNDSVKRDRNAACDQIWWQLGDEGLGLISAEN